MATKNVLKRIMATQYTKEEALLVYRGLMMTIQEFNLEIKSEDVIEFFRHYEGGKNESNNDDDNDIIRLRKLRRAH